MNGESWLVAGIGCRRGVEVDEVLDAIDTTLAANGRRRSEIRMLAAPAHKVAEASLNKAAAALSVPLVYAAPLETEAAAAAGLSPSAAAQAHLGFEHSAAEMAALCGAGRGARLLAPRQICGRVVCALAEPGQSFAFDPTEGVVDEFEELPVEEDPWRPPAAAATVGTVAAAATAMAGGFEDDDEQIRPVDPPDPSVDGLRLDHGEEDTDAAELAVFAIGAQDVRNAPRVTAEKIAVDAPLDELGADDAVDDILDLGGARRLAPDESEEDGSPPVPGPDRGAS